MGCGLLIMNPVSKNIIWVLNSIRYNRKATNRWVISQELGCSDLRYYQAIFNSELLNQFPNRKGWIKNTIIALRCNNQE